MRSEERGESRVHRGESGVARALRSTVNGQRCGLQARSELQCERAAPRVEGGGWAEAEGGAALCLCVCRASRESESTALTLSPNPNP